MLRSAGSILNGSLTIVSKRCVLDPNRHVSSIFLSLYENVKLDENKLQSEFPFSNEIDNKIMYG